MGSWPIDSGQSIQHCRVGLKQLPPVQSRWEAAAGAAPAPRSPRRRPPLPPSSGPNRFRPQPGLGPRRHHLSETSALQAELGVAGQVGRLRPRRPQPQASKWRRRAARPPCFTAGMGGPLGCERDGRREQRRSGRRSWCCGAAPLNPTARGPPPSSSACSSAGGGDGEDLRVQQRRGAHGSATAGARIPPPRDELEPRELGNSGSGDGHGGDGARKAGGGVHGGGFRPAPAGGLLAGGEKEKAKLTVGARA